MVYPPKVWERVARVRTSIEPENATLGGSASFRCGCFLQFAIDIDQDVKSVAFRTNGCAYMISAADVLAGAVEGRALNSLAGLSDESLTAAIEAEIGPLPPDRRQCAEVCIDALHAAFRNYRAVQVEEFRGEKALICTCFGVTEEAIETFIATNRPTSVEDVTAACRAGGGCGSCRMLIQEMLDGSAAYRI